ncbi:actin-binding protein WASF3 isoform X1 [Hylaeus anthracinus]|uniref:actin-binding protein WASF3 isoform X2 n=1 Tax=Hylaeus volcanicus TaxID=313075 RepID=UPI0023B84B7F|nr:actin-binding protein WASF3 isoform X2 [Hylaeus volcanicus]XP_054006147.1 actin-binding protein WASF3 isoform X1 [Hylaeus anthracinus]XP_054006148.1 actin-binding protein WASF3 isoform X1 [Hylaeus anthracinus]XP_054006149.1 actin-binding protein WASF3 isoform X1 [Hylaeus anthracinus]
MPLPKRLVEPVLVARGTIPEDFPLPSELEAVTNGTLANTIRQLSSLSRHAEDLFGELAREAHGLSDRANSLQARIDRLAVKVTQLDSNVEEVSLQDIHMRKAFKSSVVFDQQVVSRDTMPTAMMETYHQCDTPPPLDKLNVYREDGKDGLKFYTDPNYFFELWSQEMLKDTEKKLHDRGKKPHRPRNEGGGGGGGRHKKRIRQPHNTRERQRQLAVGHGEYIMPTQGVQYRAPHGIPDESLLGMVMTEPRPPRPNSIELRRSYPPEEQHLYSPPSSDHYRAGNYVAQGYEDSLYGSHYGTSQGQAGSETYQSPGGQSTPSRSGRSRPSQPPPAPPSNTSSNSTPTVASANNTPTRGRSMSTSRDTLPPPPPPPGETMSPPPMNGSIPSHLLNRNGSRSNSPLPSHHSTPTPPNHSTQIGQDETDPAPQDLPPPPPTPDPTPPRPISPPCNIPPPPPPPPPPPVANGPTPPLPLTNGDIAKMIATNPPKLKPLKPLKNMDGQLRKPVNPNIPLVDPRNDLLKAIRDGIKLRKVEKIEQKEVERVNALNDVASILARRVAVEFSDSDSASESECDSEGWGEQETNLA